MRRAACPVRMPVGKLVMTMQRRRVHRLTTTFLMVLSLLFSQLALANYDCPQQADAQAMASRMEAGLPCDGMDPQQPALCHQHFAEPGKHFEAVKLPAVSLPAVVQVLQLPLVLDAQGAAAVPPAAASEAQPPPAPLCLATLRLRV